MFIGGVGGEIDFAQVFLINRDGGRRGHSAGFKWMARRRRHVEMMGGGGMLPAAILMRPAKLILAGWALIKQSPHSFSSFAPGGCPWKGHLAIGSAVNR